MDLHRKCYGRAGQHLHITKVLVFWVHAVSKFSRIFSLCGMQKLLSVTTYLDLGSRNRVPSPTKNEGFEEDGQNELIQNYWAGQGSEFER